LGKEKHVFRFSFSKKDWRTDALDAHRVSKAMRAARPQHTISLSAHQDGTTHDTCVSIQGNPKADFLE